jgi:hypothetical protein
MGPRVALGATSIALMVVALGAFAFIPRLRHLQ